MSRTTFFTDQEGGGGKVGRISLSFLFFRRRKHSSPFSYGKRNSRVI